MTAIEEAFRDWLSGRAYTDNRGNYHLRKLQYGAKWRGRGPIAPWNVAVKRAFPSSDEFHDAATKSRK